MAVLARRTAQFAHSVCTCSRCSGVRSGRASRRRKDRIEADVVLGVVEQPGVLHFKACRSGRAVQQVVVLHAIEIAVARRGVADGDIEAGNALHELDVGFKLPANVGRNLVEIVERFGVRCPPSARRSGPSTHRRPWSAARWARWERRNALDIAPASSAPSMRAIP